MSVMPVPPRTNAHPPEPHAVSTVRVTVTNDVPLDEEAYITGT